VPCYYTLPSERADGTADRRGGAWCTWVAVNKVRLILGMCQLSLFNVSRVRVALQHQCIHTVKVTQVLPRITPNLGPFLCGFTVGGGG
jgi:hypothetical protein